MMSNRREFLKAFAGSAGLALTGLSARAIVRAATRPFYAPDDPWASLPGILRRIKPPVFPERDFTITKFGAAGDGKTDCTEAIRKAIAECNTAGGGRVVVPAGEFLTGAIHLKSNVNLHITKDATIKFSRDPKQYLPAVFTRWEGMELMNYSPFIYAFEQKNVGISGEGTIDGQADCEYWWPWKGRTECGWRKGDPDQSKARNLLLDMVARGAPVSERVFGEGSYLRPMFIQPYRCQNVLIEGVTLKNSPMWQLHPVLCTNVTVRNVNIRRESNATGHTGPNTDGCDPESCQDVLIKDCYFATGDDCIAIKSGRNDDGRRVAVPSTHIVIQGCHMQDGHGGITIGSEISGGVNNVFAEHCVMDSPSLNMALRFKNNALRGGLLENFYFRSIDVGRVSDSVVAIDFNYEEGKNGPYTPVVRNVFIDNVKSRKSKYAVDLQGLEGAPVRDVRVKNCSFDGVASGSIVRYVEGLTLQHVKVNGDEVTKF